VETELSQTSQHPKNKTRCRHCPSYFDLQWSCFVKNRLRQYELALDISHWYSQAKIMGQDSKRWILVNIQDPSEFASQRLNRDTWSNEKIKAIITESFLFWQASDGKR
jgi:hypothetical protein